MMQCRRDILAIGSLLALLPRGVIRSLGGAATGATATGGPSRRAMLAIDAPPVARAGHAVPIGIRAAAEVGCGISAVRLGLEERPFGGLAHLVMRGEKTVDLAWHIRLDATETLVLTVETIDGTSYTARRRVTVV
jgi:hypothetical protein